MSHRTHAALLAALILTTASAQAPVPEAVLAPGVDLWETPANGATHADLSATPLPAGLFNVCAPPGVSDPFAGTITFGGAPLTSQPPGTLGPTDTIVRRNGPANLPAVGSSATVPIEIVALSLVSVQPITVTYSNGQFPQQWNVKACLAGGPQQQGSMTIHQDCPQGGRFDSVLYVRPKLVFTKVGNPGCTVTFAPPTPPIDFAASGTWQQTAPPSLGLIQIPPGVQVDGNCDDILDAQPLLPTTPNFHPGLRSLGCDSCQGGATAKRLTEEEALLASHGILPAEQDVHDSDQDGVPDLGDNCPPPFPNPQQEDADGDGYGDPCDNCPATCNDQQNQDGDAQGDACDCAPFDATNSAPGSVQSLAVGGPAKQTLDWSAEPKATVYEVLRGTLAGLPVGPGGEEEVCFPGIADTTSTDSDALAPGQGHWYEVRAVDACGNGPYGAATAGPRTSDTCNQTFFFEDFAGGTMLLDSDSAPDQPAAINGSLEISTTGVVKQLAIIAAPVHALAGSTGLITIAVDPDVPQVGGFVGDDLDVQFGLRLNTDITDQNLGFTSGATYCAGGDHAGEVCAVDSDCFDGTCEVSGYCQCDTDAAESSYVTCTGHITGSINLDGDLDGTFTFDCDGGAVENSGIEGGGESVTTEKTDKARACEADKNCKLKKVCIQPVVIAQDDGSSPTSCPSFTDTKDLWKKCCIEIEVKEAKTIKKSAYRTMDESKNNTPTAEEDEMFKAENDDDGAGGCIEVYCPNQFEQDGKTSKDISGGGATYHGNTAKCKVVCVDGGASTLPAHELGHCFGLGHRTSDADLTGTIMEPTGKHDTAGTNKVNLKTCNKARGGASGKEADEKCCMKPDS